MDATVPTKIGLVGLTFLTLAIGLAMTIALPSYLAAWPDSTFAFPIAFAIVPLAAGVFFGFALVRPRSVQPALPGLLIAVGPVLVLTGLFGLAPIIEFQTFPYAHDWASVMFNYGAVATIVAGVWAIAEGVLYLRSQAQHLPTTPHPTT
jgi:hypothetical protein